VSKNWVPSSRTALKVVAALKDGLDEGFTVLLGFILRYEIDV